ncbi:MAG: hypothetical protein GEV03_26490 [Streptosporangiales bacterium]|nr:hypothetical protein [Streptosporangiales bacterium]
MSNARQLSPALVGRFLAYTTERHQCVAMATTVSSPASGIVVRDSNPLAAVRRAESAAYTSLVLVDLGAWTREFAFPDSPTILEAPGTIVPISVDSWASSLLHDGAHAVFTPSKFIRLGDWPSLRAVLEAGETATLPGVVTLVATDAAMLDSQYLPRFAETLAITSRPLALLFAAKNPPLQQRGRMASLRQLMTQVPGCLLLATEPIVAADACAHGAASAAVGISGGLRKPRRPGDLGGGDARDFLPGLFLRELWEHRSPGIYADWYANSPSPTCLACGGRALDAFDNDEADKEAVLRHNAHTWLAVLDELRAKNPVQQRRWLAEEWSSALAAHLSLRPAMGSVDADRVLRQLVELDDPMGRRTTLQGELR